MPPHSDLAMQTVSVTCPLPHAIKRFEENKVNKMTNFIFIFLNTPNNFFFEKKSLNRERNL